MQSAIDLLRTPIERIVSAHLGREWRVSGAQDMADFACHPAAILSDGAYPVFAKFSDAADGQQQFKVELAGLAYLAAAAGVTTPTALGVFLVPGGCVLVFKAVPEVERSGRHWRHIGQTLARIHKVKGTQFGFERNGYFGPLPQDNTPATDWPTFYTERRLGPGLRLAVDSGNLPAGLARRVERIIARLPALCGPVVTPTLLHGDAQKNNFISTEAGAVVIDPAVYFGHPEMDLAVVDCFEPVPEALFAGYQDELPIDPGFWGRRGLWRIWEYLAAVAVEGAPYLGRLADAMQMCE